MEEAVSGISCPQPASHVDCVMSSIDSFRVSRNVWPNFDGDFQTRGPRSSVLVVMGELGGRRLVNMIASLRKGSRMLPIGTFRLPTTVWLKFERRFF